MALAAKQYLTKRVVAVVVVCLLLALIWSSPNSQWRLRQTYKSLSDKKAKQSAESTAAALTGEQQSGSDARPHGLTTPQTNISNESPDTDAQQHKVLSPPIIIADESPDLDAQPHKVTSPPIEVPDGPPDVHEQAHQGMSTTTGITDKPPASDDQSLNFTTPSIGISSAEPFPPLPPADDEEYMAICMAVKDQHLDLPEFFSHHYHHLGIRRFYVFDDGSQPPLSTVSYPIPTSAITWIYFQPHVHSDRLGARKGIQERYYTGCVKMFGVHHSWIGFLDADEYLQMTGNETLSDFLHGWERNSTVGAVGVSWINHSSAGILTRPADGPRKAYNRCIIDNPHNDNIKVKTWVRPSLFGYMTNCHCMRGLKNDAIEVGEHGDLIRHNCDRLPITRDRWALHHFGTKSREEFLQKQERGKIRGGKAPDHFWRKIENEEQVDCLELTKYVP